MYHVSLSPIIVLKQVPFSSSPDLFKDHFLPQPTHTVFPFYLLPPLQPDEPELVELSPNQESPLWYAGHFRLISPEASAVTALQTHHFGLPIWLPSQRLSMTPGEVNFLFLDFGGHSNKMK